MIDLQIPKKTVYFIMGQHNTKRNSVVLLEKAIEAGIGIFQYREKGAKHYTYSERLDLAYQLQTVCRKHEIPFIVNDDIALAKELQADGIHLGQDDMPIDEARREVGHHMMIGISTSQVKEAIDAEQLGADYIGVGPIYETTTKKDAKQPIGLNRLRDIRRNVTLPIVAIGGIKVDNASSVFEAGANAIAVITAITHSTNLTKTVQQLRYS